MEGGILLKVVCKDVYNNLRKIAKIFIENDIAIVKSEYITSENSSEKKGVLIFIKAEDHSKLQSLKNALQSIKDVYDVTIAKNTPANLWQSN